MRWLVADSLYCPGAFFASHLDSYSHYLREYGEDVRISCLAPGNTPGLGGSNWVSMYDKSHSDVAFVLDLYEWGVTVNADKKIAQVAAVCDPMPWNVRKPDGSPAYDLILSSIPWMVEAARAAGCRAEYQALAFDTRARVCGMGVKRDLGCIFIGTTGPNHKRRTELLAELSDVVTVLPPVFGREYFKTLARATAVFSPHAEWSHGAVNNMRMFEACGMGARPVADGMWPRGFLDVFGFTFDGTAAKAREVIADAIECHDEYIAEGVLCGNTYENRIPQLVDFVRSLGGA